MAHDAIPELGPEQLKALTHPLRIRLLRALRSDGPATATALAKRLGESSGATSYHLRQLERHGFIEEVPDTGDARDRWWRPCFPGHTVEPARWLDDEAARGVVSVYQGGVVAEYAAHAGQFIGEQTRGEWDAAWVEASDFSDFRLRLTAAQLGRLRARLHAVVESFQRYDSPGAETVSVALWAFPRRPHASGEEDA